MAASYNVFLSWSGERSRVAAEALRDWLPKVLQSTKPWMSSSDIEKGARGLEEVSRALEGISVGISCITTENMNASWLLFEAGAISKTIGDKTRVCTYLLGGLQPQDVPPPLGMFQATRAEKVETRKLLHTLNASLPHDRILESNLDEVFDAMWPKLEEKIRNLPATTEALPPKRDVVEMVAEILEWTRAQSRTSVVLKRSPLYNSLLAIALKYEAEKGEKRYWSDDETREAIAKSATEILLRHRDRGQEPPPET